jgi:carbon storage regulator CsrA
MLVLSRRLLENVILKFKSEDGTEKEIKLKVIDIGSRKVRLGFETDRSVTILREELTTGKKNKQPVTPTPVVAGS